MKVIQSVVMQGFQEWDARFYRWTNMEFMLKLVVKVYEFPFFSRAQAQSFLNTIMEITIFLKMTCVSKYIFIFTGHYTDFWQVDYP